MALFLSIITLVTVSSLICLIYPGEQAIEAFFDIPIFQVLSNISDVQTPGLLAWILLMFNTVLLNIVFPVVGIFVGVRILPFSEKDGKELVFSTEKSMLINFLENLLIAFIVIPLTLLPTYIISAGFLLSNGVGVSALTIGTVIPIFFVYVIMMVTCFGCSIKNSPKMGYVFGGLFFLYSFTLNLLQQELTFENITKFLPHKNNLVENISLMPHVKTFQNAILGTWNIDFILTSLIIILALILLSIIFLYRTDYIETRKAYNETDFIENTKRRNGVKVIFGFIRKPMESLLNKLGWKYPAFKDQLQSFAGIFFIYMFATSFIMFLVALAYPGDESMTIIFTEMTSLMDSPIIAAFMFGHEITPTLEGFILYKIMLFNWIYYSPFLFIAAYDIIMRDKNTGYDEITWSMPRTRTLIIRQRTIATLVYLWLVIFTNWIALWIGQIILSTYLDVTMTNFSATAFAFIFLAIGYSLFLIIFITIALIPKQKYIMLTLIGAFFTAIFIPIIWYMNQDLSWLLYLSPFSYFDVAGLLLNDIDILGKVIPEALIFGTISFVFYFTIIKFWIPNRDIV